MKLSEKRRNEICDLASNAFYRANGFRKSHLKSVMGINGDPAARHVLEALPDDMLLEISEYLDLDAEENPRWPEPGLRVFVSHISAERARLGAIRTILTENWSMNFFLAHDDIQDGEPWAEELLRALSEMHAFVSVHSKGFAASSFCHQEVGFALARDVPRITVMDGEDPRGFIGQQQAMRWRTDEDLAEKLFERFAANTATSGMVAEGLAKKLKKATSTHYLKSLSRGCTIGLFGVVIQYRDDT